APSSVAICRIGFIWQTSSPGCSNSVQRKLPASFSPRATPSPLPTSCPSPTLATGAMPSRYRNSASNRCSRLIPACSRSPVDRRPSQQRLAHPFLVGLAADAGLGAEDAAGARIVAALRGQRVDVASVDADRRRAEEPQPLRGLLVGHVDQPQLWAD